MAAIASDFMKQEGKAMTYLKRLPIFGVIFMALLVVTVFVSKSYAQSSFGLQNRWKTNEFIHIQNGSPQSSAIDQRWMSAQWRLSSPAGRCH